MDNYMPYFFRFLKMVFLSFPFGLQELIRKSIIFLFSEEAIVFLKTSQQIRNVAKPEDFKVQLQECLSSKKYYKDEIETEPIASRIRSICFYLPQYYPFRENDLWWGKGFTEWTNVTKALPQFKGHLQPRLPSDLGFYDLRQVENHHKQAALAKKYGIHGFCYYYYWFDGKRLLDKPLEVVLQNKELNFPFCICWANENWSRRWDGNDKEILIGQSYKPGYEEEIIINLIPIISDERYIKIDGKPVIVVYRPSDLPSAKELASKWREKCRSRGIGEIFILLTHSFQNDDPRKFGFDGAIEFAPNNSNIPTSKTNLEFFNPNFAGNIFDYSSLVASSKQYRKPEYLKFRGICPSWDNEPRKPTKGNIFRNSSPILYRDWLNEICSFTDLNMSPENKYIFINAWNEWAEGAFLEPDRYYGHSYLINTYSVLKKYKSES